MQMMIMMMIIEEEKNKENIFYIVLVTVNVSVALVVMLAVCLCCRRKLPKNELLGLEGMVKMKNPDDVIVVTTVNTNTSHADLNCSVASYGDSEKRASTAVHRSLPDIPVVETNGDTGSELYETVADKSLLESRNQNKGTPRSLQKLTNISQHSSLSQADDVSSPYSRVKNSPHDYAKVMPTEHPYAQLNVPANSPSNSNINYAANTVEGEISLDTTDTHSNTDTSPTLNEPTPPAEIHAAPAIAGMISASHDLPYMTPPIPNQHFSGDSQDSSKGYTSISVREPLANILAQNNPQPKLTTKTIPHVRHASSYSHYATVSDDSDETYAAIEDSNLRQNNNLNTDIYTSGSETYAQIQPMHSTNFMVVSVEINNASTATLPTAPTGGNNNHVGQNTALLTTEHKPVEASQYFRQNSNTSALKNISSLEYNPMTMPIPPVPATVDCLRTQLHSRQASSSSNNSSLVCNYGSPKPEKRQANSPLPPTPKSNASIQPDSSSTSNLTSGRNSVISIIECGARGSINEFNEIELRDKLKQPDDNTHRKTRNLSPSKDIEGMYAKVMKKNKCSRNSPSPQFPRSPILAHKCEERSHTFAISPSDNIASDANDNSKYPDNNNIHPNNGKGRLRSNSYSTTKDHGYETIPADSMRLNPTQPSTENRKSDCYTHLLQNKNQNETICNAIRTNPPKPPNISVYDLQNNEKHYETIDLPDVQNTSNDPGYETLLIHTHDEGETKATVEREPSKLSDYDPNYEIVKRPSASVQLTDTFDDGYAKVLEKNRSQEEDASDGYSKVKGANCPNAEVINSTSSNASGNAMKLAAIPGYCTIEDAKTNKDHHNYASILETKNEVANSNLQDSDSDHYARIAERLDSSNTEHLSLNSQTVPTSCNDRLAIRPQDLSITSPTSITSRSFLNVSSINSSINITTTSTLSSHPTPSSSSQYESFTGSETDPNYESVCYFNSSSLRDNSYERLQTDVSDTQLSSSPLLSLDVSISTSSPSDISATNEHSTTAANDSKVETTSSNDINSTLLNDYFNV